MTLCPQGHLGPKQPRGFAMSHIKRRIVTILKDDTLDQTEKVEILRQLEADSLSKELTGSFGTFALRKITLRWRFAPNAPEAVHS